MQSTHTTLYMHTNTMLRKSVTCMQILYLLTYKYYVLVLVSLAYTCRVRMKSVTYMQTRCCVRKLYACQKHFHSYIHVMLVFSYISHVYAEYAQKCYTRSHMMLRTSVISKKIMFTNIQIWCVRFTGSGMYMQSIHKRLHAYKYDVAYNGHMRKDHVCEHTKMMCSFYWI